MIIRFTGMVPVPDGTEARNRELAHARNLPAVEKYRRTSDRLAVIGGGPSINSREDEIRSFDGDVWAANGAFGWCAQRGIQSTLISVDPHPIVVNWVEGVDRAVLSSACDPEVFDKLQGKDVYLVDIGHGGRKGGTSTVSYIPSIAAMLGYRQVVFYGCESCYGDKTHAYMHETREEEMRVECCGEVFLTAPDFYIYAQELSYLIRALPEFLSERSGGLLQAMVKDQEHDVVWVSPQLQKMLTPIDSCPSCGQTRGHYDDCEVGLGVI